MKLPVGKVVIPAFLGCVAVATGQTWQSAIVRSGTDGKLIYTADAEGNRIPDFSYAGFKNSSVPIPNVPVAKTISPLPGDNTIAIQTAINDVAALPMQSDGTKGALLLTAGVYRVSGSLYLNSSGVVLRGVGDGADSTSNTIIVAAGDSASQTTVLHVGGGSDTRWADQITGSQTNILSDTVLVGSRSFLVQDASPYSVGDNIIIVHPCTDAWLQAVEYGATGTDGAWTAGSQPILYNRRIAAISGSIIMIDAPVFNTLIRSRSQSYIYKYGRSGLRTMIGVERIRVDIKAPGVTTDANGNERNHAWNAVWLRQVEDAWVRNCTALHFGHAGFMTSTATRITIDSCSALDPVSIITGERRYNFNVYTASQLVLFKNCTARHGRHDYVSNGTSWTSGCVFVDCTSDATHNATEGHRRWSQALLYDNITFVSPTTTGYLLGLYNRGDYGTGHGWASAHSVAWNCSAPGGTMIIQKPPTAQNYAIGCTADTIAASAPYAPFTKPLGYVEGRSRPGLQPRSLFYAQLTERLAASTGVHDMGTRESSPVEFTLSNSYPNPANPSSRIEVVLSQSAIVNLRVFDLAGREVAILLNDTLPPGIHKATWHADAMASGVYFCRMNVLDLAGRRLLHSETRRILVLR